MHATQFDSSPCFSNTTKTNDSLRETNHFSTPTQTSSESSANHTPITDTLSVYYSLSSLLGKKRIQHPSQNSPGELEDQMWELSPISGFIPDDKKEARLKIAMSYLKGEGVPVDEIKGLALLMELKEYAPAQYHIAECHEYGIGTEKDEPESVIWHKKSALQGYAPAQNNYAVACSCGIGVGVNREKALPWYEAAVAQGHDWAQLNLGRHYKNRTNEPLKAVALFKQSAEQGNIQSHNALGDCYQEGVGVEKNPHTAFDWYKKAAQFYPEFNHEKDIPWHLKEKIAGKAMAQYRIALCYQDGVGVETNPKEAVKWLEKSAALGNTDAINRLGIYYEWGTGVEKNLQKAIGYYQQAANKENTWGDYNLAQLYQNGKGVPQNFKEAFELFKKSAEKGNADALNRLGVCYAQGKGVQQDRHQALSYYQQAANKGNNWGEYNLAWFYKTGGIVPQDEKKAFELFKKSAEKGNIEALNALGECYEKGSGVAWNVERAADYYRQSAEKKDAQGQYRLALCYLNGMGVSQNEKEAVKWLRESAHQGNTDAQFKLAHCLANGMKGVPEDRSAASDLMLQAALSGHLQARKALAQQPSRNDHPVMIEVINIWKKVHNQRSLNTEEQNFLLSWLQDNFNIKKKNAIQFSASNEQALANVFERNQCVTDLWQNGAKALSKILPFLNAEQQKNIETLLTCWHDQRIVPVDVQMEILERIIGYYLRQNALTHKFHTIATHYQSGTIVGVSQTEAMFFYEKAAQLGHAPSQYELGLYFENGPHKDGINYNQAFAWYLQAGCNGYSPAMVKLEPLYRLGLGVEENAQMADIWLKLHKKEPLSVEDQACFVRELQSYTMIKRCVISGLHVEYQRLINEWVDRNNHTIPQGIQ